MAHRMFLQYYPHGDLKGVFYPYHKVENGFKKIQEKAKRAPKSKKRKGADVEAEDKEDPKALRAQADQPTSSAAAL